MDDIMKIFKSLKDSRFIDKGGQWNHWKWSIRAKRFIGLLLGALAASIIGNILARKGVIQAGEGTIRQVKELLEQERKFNSALSFS